MVAFEGLGTWVCVSERRTKRVLTVCGGIGLLSGLVTALAKRALRAMGSMVIGQLLEGKTSRVAHLVCLDSC